MIWLLFGGAALVLLVSLMRAFERASVSSVKALMAWVMALGGATLALLLVLTGREGAAIWALAMFGPLLHQKWLTLRGHSLNGRGAGGDTGRGGRGGRAGGGAGAGERSSGGRSSGGMSRDEAFQVLGLRPGASAAEIREAHRRLMRGAHPDAGGSDWLAARINQARDILLG